MRKAKPLKPPSEPSQGLRVDLLGGIKVMCRHSELVDFRSLLPYPKNPNIHRPEQAPMLAKIIARAGWRSPIVVSARSGFITKGHGRLEAAKLLFEQTGECLVPVERQHYDTEAEELTDIIADNQIAELSALDAELVMELGKEGLLELEGFDSELLGFDTGAWEDLAQDVDARAKNPHVLLQIRPEVIDLSALKPHPKNYKSHPKDQIEHIAKSIRQFGLYRQILVAEDNTILAGHGLVEACRSLGRKRVPVTRFNIGPDHPAAMKLLIADNEVGHLGENDDRALSELLATVNKTADEGLLGTGYDISMLTALVMVTRHADEIPDRAAATAWVGLPEHEQPEAPFQLIITFENEASRKKFITDTGMVSIHCQDSKRSSARWPPSAKRDLASVRFEQNTKP